MLLLILAGCLLGAAVLLVLETVSPADRKGHEAARIVKAWARDSDQSTPRRPRGNPLKPVGDFLLRRSTSDATRSRLRDRLAAAGLGASLTPADFVSIRLGAVLLGILGGLVAGSAIGTAAVAFMLCIALAVAGYVLPGALLDRRARARRDRVDDALPDALDLLAVTVEAGVGLYGAIAKVVESTQGPLADEFALCLAEMRVGESSSGALKRLAARINHPDF